MDQDADRVVATEATERDVAAFATFFWEAWQEAGPDAPGFAGATEEVIRELTTREAILERIGGPDRRMFLARQGGRVVGFSATKRIDDVTVELAGVVVLQSIVGRGIGTPLVERAVQVARHEGYLRMVVRTETTNDRALRFYQTRGFTLTGSMTELVEDEPVEVWELARDL
jgi:GNAT superfamily N-acetyltransferase